MQDWNVRKCAVANVCGGGECHMVSDQEAVSFESWIPKLHCMFQLPNHISIPLENPDSATTGSHVRAGGATK